jgi:hypothetical protein
MPSAAAAVALDLALATEKLDHHPGRRHGLAYIIPVEDRGCGDARNEPVKTHLAGRLRQEGYEEAEHRAGEDPGPGENRQPF